MNLFLLLCVFFVGGFLGMLIMALAAAAHEDEGWGEGAVIHPEAVKQLRHKECDCGAADEDRR